MSLKDRFHQLAKRLKVYSLSIWKGQGSVDENALHL